MKKYTVPLLLFFCSVLFVNSSFAQISMKKGDGGLWFVEQGRKIAFYQKELTHVSLAPSRNNFLHPVLLPDGTEITEDAPADHIHHRGIFWAWHQVIIDGKKIGDPWMLDDFKQDVQSVEFSRLPDGNGEFRTHTLWSSEAYENGAKPYMDERLKMTILKLEGRKQIILFEIQLKALAENLKLGGSDDEKGYGGFSVRMELPEDVAFHAKHKAVQPENTAVEVGQFVNVSGSVGKNGKRGGVMIYASERNQKDPQTWILRKKDSMQNAVFPGRNPIPVSTKYPIVLKYALVLYNGKIKEEMFARRLENLLTPDLTEK